MVYRISLAARAALVLVAAVFALHGKNNRPVFDIKIMPVSNSGHAYD
jgi:hypothetical protein